MIGKQIFASWVLVYIPASLCWCQFLLSISTSTTITHLHHILWFFFHWIVELNLEFSILNYNNNDKNEEQNRKGETTTKRRKVTNKVILGFRKLKRFYILRQRLVRKDLWLTISLACRKRHGNIHQSFGINSTKECVIMKRN